MFNPNAFDNMTFDIHAQDIGRMRANFVGVGRKFDSAGFAATTDLHLGFNHNRVLSKFCLFNRLVNS